MYLISSDFKKQIQSDNLSQIIGGDSSILASAQLAAIEEVRSYLVQKYDLTKEFADLPVWVYNVAYNAGDRVYLDATAYSATATYTLNSLCLQAGNVYRCTTAITVPEAFTISKWSLCGAQYDIFFVPFPNPVFDYNTFYNLGDVVFWKNKNYTNLIATSTLGQSSLLQFAQIQNVPYPNVAPDDVNSGSQVWGAGVTYEVPANTAITNTTYWTAGDNRSQQLVTYLIDITLYHLHSRIAPRNIPDLRVKRYDDAKAWLKLTARGEVTANIPTIQPATGMRIRFGGNIKQQNSYHHNAFAI